MTAAVRPRDPSPGRSAPAVTGGGALQVVLDAIPQIVWTADDEGVLDYFNQGWVAYTGLSTDQTLACGWEAAMHPDDVDAAEERWSACAHDGTPFELELRLRRAHDHHYRWHLCRARPLDSGAGSPRRWIGTCTDVHDQRTAEEAMLRAALTHAREESARRFRAIVESVRIPAVELNAAGRVTFANDAMVATTGHSRAQLVGADWFATCAPTDALARARFERTIASNDGAAHDEYEITTRAGATRILEWDHTTLRDERGRVVGLASFGVDVTERRAESTALTLLLEVTRAVAEAPDLDDALSLILRHLCATTGWTYGETWLPSPDGEVIECTHRHEGRPGLAAFGERSRGLRVRAGEDLVGAAWARRTSLWLAELDDSPIFLRRQDAHTAGLHAGAAIPVLDGDRVVAVLAFFVDFPRPSDERRLALVAVVAHQLGAIVARRRAEDEVARARDAAEAASRAKSEFLARMSHELRTPLNSIIGFTDFLARSQSIATRPQDAHLVERVRANGRHLLGLINDVLDLSKVEAGHLALERAVVDLPELVRDVVSGLAPRSPDRDVAVDCLIPPRVAPLCTDATRLRQILLNLVGNALKFTERGAVRVEVLTDAVSAAPVAIVVADTGIGIPPDRVEAVFGAFEQADSSITRRFGGTGLGLPIARALCEALGYRLSVESSVGVGTTFRVALPHPATPLPAS